jgi:hypothetical protein
VTSADTATPTTVPAPAASSDTGGAWMTRMLLNPRSRQVQRDLRNVADLHRTVMRLVPDGLGATPRAQAGALFRLETDGAGEPVLLVQTRVRPSTDRLPTGYARTESRPMGALLTALRPGLPDRYRLAANAVRRCGPHSTTADPKLTSGGPIGPPPPGSHCAPWRPGPRTRPSPGTPGPQRPPHQPRPALRPPPRPAATAASTAPSPSSKATPW